MNAALFANKGNQLTPDEIIQEVKHLPSSPKVLPRLKRLLTDGNSSLEEIAMLIRLDTALAARVLRVGNSAYYNKGLRCQTVDEAVNRVGFDQVYELVSYAVASQVLVRPLEVYSIEAEDIWKQSVACALAAESIALQTGDDCNIAYTVGLLHRIGMVVINEWALRQRPLLRLTGTDTLEEYTRSERAALGCTQADVGGELLRQWDFPPEMSEPVHWQYAPHATASALRVASLLYAARWVRAVVCSGAGVVPPPHPGILSVLRLTQLRLSMITHEVSLRLETISTLLDETGAAYERESMLQ